MTARLALDENSLQRHTTGAAADEEGELAAWAGYFLGHLARAVNRIRGRSGSCFERRYSAEPILDDEALFDRLVYVVSNPVNAGLCKRVKDWPGVVRFAPDGDSHEIPVSWIDREPYRFARARARLRGESAPKGDVFRVQGRLVVDPLPSTDASRSDRKEVIAVIEAQERELAEERRRAGRKPLSRKQVLTRSWRSAPRQPKRSPRPLCHAADPGLRERFREGFRDFVSLFREASELLRRGDPNVSFPDWCYPPGLPLLRPAQVGAAWSSAG